MLQQHTSLGLLHSEDAILAKILSNDLIVSQRNAILVDLAKTFGSVRRVPLYMGKMESICHFPVICLLAYGDTALKS